MAYLLFLAPAMLLALYAQFKVKAAFAAGQTIAAGAGISGRETAERILESHGIRNVRVEQTQAMMGDHYDPKAKVLRLSPDVYSGRSITALGVAAHEVGHAIQDAEKYGPLVIRNGIVPMASIGSNASFFLLFLGFMMNSFGMVLLGIAAFSLVVVFQLVNLPVEFDASNRARSILLQRGLVSPDEERKVAKVLNAAALTYVAATVTSIMTLLYYLLQAGFFGGRDE